DTIDTVTCQVGEKLVAMSLEWQARPTSLAWSNPLARWWALMTLVSGGNIAAWGLVYHQLHPAPTHASTPRIRPQPPLRRAYFFCCACRSFLPRADVQRICLFDTWLSSVVVGRSVATVAEICFAVQCAIVLHRLGTSAGAEMTVNTAWVVMPLILVAQCFSWYAVLTTNYLGNAIENSIWAVAFSAIGVGLCRVVPDFNAPIRLLLPAPLL